MVAFLQNMENNSSAQDRLTGGKWRECLERVAALKQNPREKQAVARTCCPFVGERLLSAPIRGFGQARSGTSADLCQARAGPRIEATSELPFSFSARRRDRRATCKKIDALYQSCRRQEGEKRKEAPMNTRDQYQRSPDFGGTRS